MENAVGTLYEERDVGAVARHLLQYKENCILKDVLAPEAVAAVRDHFNILMVDRPAADIVYLRLLRSPFPWEMELLPPELRPEVEFEPMAMNSQWLPVLRRMKTHLVDGVLWAQLLLREAAHEVCHYDELVSCPEVLWSALERMGYEPKRTDYSDSDQWAQTATTRFALRRTREHREIQDLVRSRRSIVEAAWRQA